MDKELAYEINGSVYFRVSKHGKYGTLASLDKSGMEVCTLCASRRYPHYSGNRHYPTCCHYWLCRATSQAS